MTVRLSSTGLRPPLRQPAVRWPLPLQLKPRRLTRRLCHIIEGHLNNTISHIW